MPPGMADAIDRFFADPSSGVRRGRPVRKPEEPSDTFVGTDAAAARIGELTASIEEPKVTSYEVKSVEELTALLQEMEATEGGVYDEPG